MILDKRDLVGIANSFGIKVKEALKIKKEN